MGALALIGVTPLPGDTRSFVDLFWSLTAMRRTLRNGEIRKGTALLISSEGQDRYYTINDPDLIAA